MKIKILLNSLAYSFIEQGEALNLGFLKLKINSEVIYATSETETQLSQLKDVKDTVIISIANWVDFNNYIKLPTEMGFKVFPWFVIDDFTLPKEFADKYNMHKLLITPSQHCKDNFIRSGIKKEYIHVIPAAINTDEWKILPQQELEYFLDLLSTPNPNGEVKTDLRKAKQEGFKIIYTTGGPPSKKGALEMIRALAKLEKDTYKYIYILKSWPHQNLFKAGIEELELAESLGIADRIRYISGEFSRKFMINLMNIVDIYAAPSRYEGFGLPLAEAQACGKPVLTSFATAAAEIVVNGKSGVIVNCKKLDNGQFQADVDELSEALKEMISGDRLLKEMSRNAVENVRKNYDPVVVAKQFLEMLKG